MWVQQRNVQNGSARYRLDRRQRKDYRGLRSFGYRVAIAEETVGDVSMFLHKVALFEIARKYADVMSLEELVNQL